MLVARKFNIDTSSTPLVTNVMAPLIASSCIAASGPSVTYIFATSNACHDKLVLDIGQHRISSKEVRG